MHPSIYNIQPKRLSELIDEVLAEIKADGGFDEEIRRMKACKIEDIFRGAKMAQLYDKRFVEELSNPSAFFDKLYELDLHTLEAYSMALDNCNTKYMRDKVEEHNRADWNKRNDDDNGWLHLDIR